MRSAVSAQAATLEAVIDRHHLGRDPQGWGEYSACSPTAPMVSYGQSLSVQSPTGMSNRSFNRLLVTTLRQAGWKVIVLDVAKIHQIVPVTHPIDHVSKRGVYGAVNVQTLRKSGTEAVIFLNSACFDASRDAAAVHGAATRIRYAIR
jgi:hypothetical protein